MRLGLRMKKNILSRFIEISDFQGRGVVKKPIYRGIGLKVWRFERGLATKREWWFWGGGWYPNPHYEQKIFFNKSLNFNQCFVDQFMCFPIRMLIVTIIVAAAPIVISLFYLYFNKIRNVDKHLQSIPKNVAFLQISVPSLLFNKKSNFPL